MFLTASYICLLYTSVTQIDQPDARPDLAAMWLELTGCKKIFYVSSVTGEGVGDILDYLREEGRCV